MTVSLLTDLDHKIVGKMLYTLNRWTWKCFLCNTMTKRDTFQGLLTQNFNKDKALAKDVDPKSPCACLFVGHDHLQEKRWYLAAEQAIKSRFFSGYNLAEILTFSLLQSSSILCGESQGAFLGFWSFGAKNPVGKIIKSALTIGSLKRWNVEHLWTLVVHLLIPPHIINRMLGM